MSDGPTVIAADVQREGTVLDLYPEGRQPPFFRRAIAWLVSACGKTEGPLWADSFAVVVRPDRTDTVTIQSPIGGRSIDISRRNIPLLISILSNLDERLTEAL